jgi:hypothetical protein
MSPILLLIVVVFLAGIYFCAKPVEGFANSPDLNRCPNILIQKDAKFYLYNSKLAKIPGVNPVEFNNLEEYTEFLDWQRSQNIRCPVLYVQQTYDAQGHPVYKVRPSPNDLQGGLPPSAPYSKPPNPTLLVDATQSDRPYNVNSYPAFDNSSYYVGTTTPLDNMNTIQENQGISPDPMDPNWGGAEYTQSLVDQGYYAGNEVNLPGR